MTSSEKEEKQNHAPIKYYGKKTYLVHPLLAQVEVLKDKSPNYQDENLIENLVGDIHC